MKILLIILLVFSAYACSENPSVDGSDPSVDWLIPSDEVLDGGPGKDGIPSVDDPKFSTVQEIDAAGDLGDGSLIIGIVKGGGAKAYPHQILDWHEIVNDELGDWNVAMTYCPLTGTGVAWDRDINNTTTTFGVSGKLYNTNLMPYDRETDSYWSQMRLDCVNGDLINTEISTFHILETSWATWKKAYPNSDIMNRETGFTRFYGSYPYGDYITNDDNIIFPVSNLDERLPAKERVLGVIGETNSKVYSVELFETDRIITDNYDGKDLIIIGSKTDNYVLGFEDPNLNGLEFVADQLPVVAEDQDGNRIDMFGEFVDGPDKGDNLVPLNAYMGYFFAFGTFDEELEIYED